MISSQPKLYGSIICPFVQRVRAVLEYLNIAYSYQEVDIFSYENREAWYKALNPSGVVPTLEIDNAVINESLCIIEFLSERQGFALHPEDLLLRAQMRRWNAYFESNVVSTFFGAVFAFAEQKNEEVQSKLEATRNQLKFLAKHSKLIERQGKAYFWGDKPTLTDMVLLPHLQSLSIVAAKFLNIPLFEDSREEDKEHLQALAQYYEKAKASFEPLALITYRLKELPPLEKNTVLREMGITSLEKFDFEAYLVNYYQKRFLKK